MREILIIDYHTINSYVTFILTRVAMRKYYSISIIFLSLTSQIISQNSIPSEKRNPKINSKSSVLDLYPLHIGNYWQYKVTVDSDFDSEDTIYYSYREIIKDTLMPNGIFYKKIFESRNPTLQPYDYIRLDSITGCLFYYAPDGNFSNNELLKDSLGMMEKDTIFTEVYTIICTNVDSIDLFGESRLQKEFYIPIIPVTSGYRFVEGIGETCMWHYIEDIVRITYTNEFTYAKISGEEYGQLVTVEDKTSNRPFTFSLSQNYPNPFNPSTIIRYEIPDQARNDNMIVVLKVYDVLGNKIATLVNEEKLAGSYEVKFDGNELTSGVYLYRLQAGDYNENKKMILLK